MKKPKPIGRPPGRTYTVHVNVAISPAQARKLARLAKRGKCTRSTIIRGLIDAAG